ncbi:chorismate synthase [Helicobacter muridarum]|uniref:Chorismate synthase n=1 Tax=Helicobacter muridarum TaxID=216 RepID=A0A099TY25_9HELI|nr:chorismate synthase [Helicobacter muridarum]TLD97975.1 chorismate synthase [Helicobacter muridarum]STQ86158.1 chorismate synthase [Helicobacter muridarum]
MDTIGILLQFSSFGESHGKGIGGILSGMPAGLEIDYEFLKNEISRRKGGSKFATPRKEDDEFEILSGIFDGKTTGTPIGFFIPNNNIKSKDYSAIKDIFRPSHADFSYYHKYGIRDYKGGGRSSARETVARVLAGGIAKLLLKEFDISIQSGITGVGNIVSKKDFFDNEDFEYAKQSEIFSLDKTLEEIQKKEITNAKKQGDSIGASAIIRVKNAPIGLGEPLGYKLDSILARDLMGLNAVKAVEIGSGMQSSRKRGSSNNDCINQRGFITNHSGGILGGISNGEDIIITTHFKPTPSIFKQQQSIDIQGNETTIKLQGRHDPCVGVRGSIVCESIVALIMADMLMLNTSSKLQNLKKIYNNSKIK